LPIIFNKYLSLPDSIYEMLRYINATTIYFIVRKTENVDKYFRVFLVIAIVQSLLGIDQLTSRSFESLLNNLSTGYLQDNIRLSATIQYANVTGIVILLGSLIAYIFLPKYKEENIKTEKTRKINLKEILMIGVVLLSSVAITLTKSRTATVVMFASYLLVIIANYIKKNKEEVLKQILLFMLIPVLSSVIEKLINIEQYGSIYWVILLFTIVCIVIIKLMFMAINNEKIKQFTKSISENKKIKYLVLLFLFVLTIITFTLPKKFKIGVQNNIYTLDRGIYNFKNDENEVSMKIKTLSEDTRYRISIIAYKEDYREEYLATFNYYDNVSGIFNEKINIPKNTRNLKARFVSEKGSFEVEYFKINNKEVKLSYRFLPDDIVFKVKDTFSGVYGDSLRVEYIKDSIKLLKKSPVIGLGGEAFKHGYPSVQERDYVSSEAHSALLQALVEVGIVGTTILVLILTLSILAIIKLINFNRLIKHKQQRKIMALILGYISLLSIVIFDLGFSYAFIIFVFTVYLALLINEYCKIVNKNFIQEVKNKKQFPFDWSYIKIIFASVSIVTLLGTAYITLNAYRASLIVVPKKNTQDTILRQHERIVYLEEKIRKDPYNIDYRSKLNAEGYIYKINLTESYLNLRGDENKQLRKEVKEELDYTIVTMKENADLMLEHEYYNKHVLKEVADTYIYNFTSFAEIYSKQFEGKELAYKFYLTYVIKLMDRIMELNPISKKANEMYEGMKQDYIEELESKNKYLNSESIGEIILRIKE
ncbi:MAG: O-antigen ligase family protein, partial [Clostridia bacterium]|nr:O-antigen ligase family protein [Clostridia bacterium]